MLVDKKTPPPCVPAKRLVPLVSKADTRPPNGPLVTQLSGPGGTLTKKPEVAVWLPTVTVSEPVVAPIGTVVVMLVAVLAVTVAAVPLKLTVLLAGVAEKFVPVMVTVAPTRPLAGVTLVMVGAVTVKLVELVTEKPAIVTVMGPAPTIAAAGTEVVMLVAVLTVTVASMPLNFTVLFAGVSEKLVPVMVTVVVAPPLVGVKLVMAGIVLTETPAAVPAKRVLVLDASEGIFIFGTPGKAVQLAPLL